MKYYLDNAVVELSQHILESKKVDKYVISTQSERAALELVKVHYGSVCSTYEIFKNSLLFLSFLYISLFSNYSMFFYSDSNQVMFCFFILFAEESYDVLRCFVLYTVMFSETLYDVPFKFICCFV